MKKKQPSKKLPEFTSEEEEQTFWETHDVREYINWDNAESFVNRVFRDKKAGNLILDELKKHQKK